MLTQLMYHRKRSGWDFSSISKIAEGLSHMLEARPEKDEIGVGLDAAGVFRNDRFDFIEYLR